MQKFKDGLDREWEIRLTYGAIERFKEEASVDLLDLKQFASLSFSIPVFVNILYYLTGAKAKGIEPVDFKDGFSGDTFDNAYAAFQEEYISFFPQSQRETMRAALGQANQVTTMAANLGTEELTSPTTTEGLRKRIESARSSIRGQIDTALKESPA